MWPHQGETIMKQILVTAAAFTALALGGLGLSSTVLATPLAGEPADQVERTLETEGYAVRINEAVDVPLAQCNVIGVSGLRGTDDNGKLEDPSRLNVAFLDVDCPSHS
jgi:hypothetical protein